MPDVTSKLTIELVDDVSSPEKKIAAALQDAAKRALELGKAMEQGGLSGRLAQQLGKLGAGAKDVEKVVTAFKDFTKVSGIAAKASDWTKADISKVRAWETATISAFKRVEQEERNRARIAEQSARESARAADAAAKAQERSLQRQIAQQQRAAEQERRIGERRRESFLHGLGHTAGSLGGMIVGGEIAHTGVRWLEGGADLEAARNRIRAVSGGETEVNLASQIAVEAAKANPLTTQAQSIMDYGELRSLALSAHHGEAIDQTKIRNNVLLMAKARSALAASGYDLGDDEAKQLAQGLEGSGRAMDPQGQEKMLDAYVRAKQVFGNAIQASMIRDFVANAKASNFSTSDSAFFTTMFARMAQGNASRLGNEASQTLSSLGGGHMTPGSANWLASLGLINKDQIQKGAGGKFFLKGDIKGHDLLSTDQTTWAQTILKQAIEAHGDVADSKVDARMAMLRKQDLASNPKAVIDEESLRERAMHGLIADALQKSGFRPTVIDNLAHSIANEFQTSKDVEQMKNAMGLNASQTVSKNPVAAFQELTKSIENFGSVLTNPLMKSAAGWLDGLASGISSLSVSLGKFQEDNPTLAKFLGGGAAAGLIGGGGALAWGALDGLFNGFGLKGSAAALDVSAAALQEAAVALGAKGGVSAITGAAGAAGAAGAGWLARGLAVGRALLKGPLGVAGFMWSAYELDKLNPRTADHRYSDLGEPAPVTLRNGRPSQRMLQQYRLYGDRSPLRMGESLQALAAKYPGGTGGGIGPTTAGWSAPGIQFAKDKAAEAGQQMKESLSILAKPIVDSGSIEAALAAARQLEAILRGLSNISISLPSGAQKIRGVHSDAGISPASRNGF